MPLSCLPGGRTNVYCRMLGIPTDVVDATEHLLQMADELYTDTCVTDQTWAKLAARWSPREILEFLMAAGFYFMVSGILNTFGVELDEGVPGWPNVSPA